jgi:hypothetical protein
METVLPLGKGALPPGRGILPRANEQGNYPAALVEKGFLVTEKGCSLTEKGFSMRLNCQKPSKIRFLASGWV